MKIIFISILSLVAGAVMGFLMSEDIQAQKEHEEKMKNAPSPQDQARKWKMAWYRKYSEFENQDKPKKRA